MGRRRLAWLAIPALLACAGCGNARSQPPALGQLGPQVSLVNYSASPDVSFGRPSSWTVSAGTPPQVAQLSSGSAVATIYAYPRTDLDLSAAGVAASRQRLLASLHSRAPGFVVSSTRLRKVDGANAVEIAASGRIAGHKVRTLSTHVYKGAAEYVIDAYARPKFFREARTQAFDPLLATIHLGGFPAGPVSGGVKAP